MKIAEEHASSAETETRGRSSYAAFPLYSKFTTTWRLNMSERTVIAYFEVDEGRAFDGFGDGPVPYLEHEAVCLEKSGIFLTGAVIADEDADNPKEAYLVYLARFCFEHFGDSDACPMSYKKWRNS